MTSIIKKILIVSMVMYLLGGVTDSIPQDCLGWQCDEVVCPLEYAVKVENKGYLPCEMFEKYADTLDESLLIK